MKLSIFGILLGTGMFWGGFVHHDVDEKIYIHQWERLDWYVDSNNGENKAYLLGMAGAMITAISVKSILDRDRDTPPKAHKPVKKFRLTMQFLTGIGLMEGGLWLHELGRYYDWRAVFETPDFDRVRKLQSNTSEHIGYGVGALGAAGVGLALKDVWDGWRRDEVTSVDKAYEELRASLKSNSRRQNGIQWDARRRGHFAHSN